MLRKLLKVGRVSHEPCVPKLPQVIAGTDTAAQVLASVAVRTVLRLTASINLKGIAMTVAIANRTDADIQAEVLAELNSEPQVQAPEGCAAWKAPGVTVVPHRIAVGS